MEQGKKLDENQNLSKRSIVNTHMHILMRKDVLWHSSNSNIRECFVVHQNKCDEIVKSYPFIKAVSIMRVCSKRIRFCIKEVEETEFMEFSFFAPFEIWTRVIKKTEEWKELNEYLAPFVIKEKECCEIQHSKED